MSGEPDARGRWARHCRRGWPKKDAAVSEVDVGIEGVAWLAFLGRCRSGDSFGAFSIESGLPRIFSVSSRLRAHHALVLSETKPHHFTGTIIPFSSPSDCLGSVAGGSSQRRASV